MMISTMMQTTNVGLTGMMNDGRHQSFKSNCCCFGNGYGGYQDQHRGCHANPTTNLAYYQQPTTTNSYTTPMQQNTWYNNNEYTDYVYHENTSSTSSGCHQGQQQQQSWNQESSSPMWSEYYNSYPTPPTPAGSTVSTNSGGNDCPPSVASSMHSIPSDHYPPTPYSVDLSSPTSNTSDLTSSNYISSNFVATASSKIDIPLHELIGAAEAVEADLLESMKAEKAASASMEAEADKPKNMASSTCSTSSSINSSCWKESCTSTEQQPQEQLRQQQRVAEMAASATVTSAAVNVGAVVEKNSAAADKFSKLATVDVGAVGGRGNAGAEVNFVKVVHGVDGHHRGSADADSEAAKRYDPEQLQRCLSDACDDWFWRDEKRLGYPLNRLKRARSPSPPCLDSQCEAWSSSDEDDHLDSQGPPRLEMQPKVKTIRLTFDEKKKQPKKYPVTKFTFSCSCCWQSWPLHSANVDKISQHLSQSGTAPLLKPTRVAFSQFFQFFAFKVKLLVNPKTSTVSLKTILNCNQCPKTFNFEQENEDLPRDLYNHLKSLHCNEDLPQNFCWFCDRKVQDMTRHLDEYFSIHHSRLLALATCHHTSEKLDVESECRKCGQLYEPDPRLPDWYSRAACNNCLFWCLKNEDSRSKVVLCQFCRQGKFGFTKSCQSMSISVCANCFKMGKAFQKMTDTSQCRSHVTGMLNELLKQITEEPKQEQNLPEATFSLRQLLQTSVLDLSSKVPGKKLTKFQAFNLQNIKTVEAVNDQFFQSQNTTTEENLNLACSKCGEKFENWTEMVAHIWQESGSLSKHLSKSLDQSLVMLSTDAKVLSLCSVLRCRKCKFYLPTNSDRQLHQVVEHVQKCFKEKDEEINNNSACACCGARSHRVPASKVCAGALKGSLALHCNPCLVCKMAVRKCEKHDTLNSRDKVEKCFAIITKAFNEDESDSIEELIVASRSRILISK